MFLRLIPLGMLCALTGFSNLPIPAEAASAIPVLSADDRVLTLEEALARTLRSSPDLTVASEELYAVAAEALQAGRLPNPELTVSLENIAGDGGYQDTDAAELTIELSQPIELGGKRRLRREAAALNQQLASSDQNRVRAGVLASTHQRYIDVLAAQEAVQLAREQAELAERSLDAAEERIKAGKSPHIDRLRLQGEAGLARLAVAQAERTLVTARQTLATSWGGSQPDFGRVDGDLAKLPGASDLPEVEATLERGPDAVSRRVAVELRSNELAQVKARRIPDPSLAVGWRQFKEGDEDAWLLGFSVPLPVYSQGQEEVVAASRRLNGARARELSARTQALSVLRTAWQSLADARAEADVLGNQVVPAAAEGFAAAEFGYRAGKFALIELLDAQRTLFESRQRQLAAQTASHLAGIELQRLQGTAVGAATP